MFWLEALSEAGDAKIHAINFAGQVDKSNVIDVPCEDFYERYAPVKDGQLPENANYPSEGALRSSVWNAHVHASKVTLALSLLTNELGEMQVLCRSTPKKAVFALKAIT